MLYEYGEPNVQIVKTVNHMRKGKNCGLVMFNQRRKSIGSIGSVADQFQLHKPQRRKEITNTIIVNRFRRDKG